MHTTNGWLPSKIFHYINVQQGEVRRELAEEKGAQGQEAFREAVNSKSFTESPEGYFRSKLRQPNYP